jgi:hypothetical protein
MQRGSDRPPPEEGEHRPNQHTHSKTCDEGASPSRPRPPGERYIQPLATLPEAAKQQRHPGQQGHKRYDIDPRQPVSWTDGDETGPSRRAGTMNRIKATASKIPHPSSHCMTVLDPLGKRRPVG